MLNKVLPRLASVAVIALAACDQAPTTASSAAITPTQLKDLESRVKDLEAQMARANSDIGSLQTDEQVLFTGYSEAAFDPTDSKYQRIDVAGGVGSFAVSVDDIHQFGDGVRVRLNLGNLTTARIDGAVLNLEYGPRRPQFGSNDYFAKQEAWSKALQKRDQNVLENLQPGSWNPVTVVLPQIDEKNFGYLKIRISTATISLRAK